MIPVDADGNRVHLDSPVARRRDAQRLRLLAKRGKCQDVAEAEGITLNSARKWAKAAGCSAPHDGLRRLLAVQELRRLGLYEEEARRR